MPVRAYIWKLKKGHYGHASLELSDTTYISWWPQSTRHKAKCLFGSVPPDDDRTLESDIRDEESQPDKTYILPRSLDLNEEKIKAWWKTVLSSTNWGLLGNNCCRMVKAALSAGGLKTEWTLIETPEDLIDFFDYLCSENYDGPRTKKTY